MLLAYRIAFDEDVELEKRSIDFKNLVFATNTELFFRIWPDEGGEAPVDEEQIEWEIPETEADVQRMLAEMRQAGWQG